MTPKSAHPRTSRHPAGMSALTTGGAARPGTRRPPHADRAHSRHQHPAQPPARPGPVGPVAAQRRRRPVRPGRGRRRGQLHRPVPDGRNRPPPPRHRRPGSRHPRRRRPGLRLPGHRPGPARPPRPPRPGAQPGLRRRQRVHERHRRRTRLAQPGHLGPAPGGLRPGQRHPDRRRPRWLARHQHLADEAATPLAILGGLLLWLLRLALAPASTLAGFRAWVLAECPVAPGRRPAPAPHPRKATKTARFLDLVTERHGSLASIPLNRVAGISADLAPQLDLNTGAARTALRKAVLAARNGAPR